MSRQLAIDGSETTTTRRADEPPCPTAKRAPALFELTPACSSEHRGGHLTTWVDAAYGVDSDPCTPGSAANYSVVWDRRRVDLRGDLRLDGVMVAVDDVDEIRKRLDHGLRIVERQDPFYAMIDPAPGARSASSR